MQKDTVVQRITRFFWIPRGAGRQQPTPYWRLIGVWLLVLAFGATVTAVGWDDEFGGSYIMAVMLLWNVVDDIIDGVRHRWPAALAAVAALSGASQLTSAVLPGSLEAAWAATIASAAGVTLGFAVAAAITRLPERLAAAR
ncbi:hypothetical protein [Streptomyces sp. LUP47B]|uniref:hypothetical protein n=1 Tax=Streptomyces sp. LUP47B TaxID=1890286 RepID=UPI0008515C73|nr:hypothetical protein [Streptomyces sp. LUP47B]